MQKRSSVLFALAGGILIGALLCYGVLFLGGTPLPGCADYIAEEAIAPTGDFVATVFVRNCGATADFTTFVNIRPAGSKFDGDAFPVALILGGRRLVNIEWTAPRQLLVRRPAARDALFRETPLLEGITLKYLDLNGD